MNNYKPWKDYRHDPKKSNEINIFDNLSQSSKTEIQTRNFFSGGDVRIQKPYPDYTYRELDEIRKQQKAYLLYKKNKLGIKQVWSS